MNKPIYTFDLFSLDLLELSLWPVQGLVKSVCWSHSWQTEAFRVESSFVIVDWYCESTCSSVIGTGKRTERCSRVQPPFLTELGVPILEAISSTLGDIITPSFRQVFINKAAKVRTHVFERIDNASRRDQRHVPWIGRMRPGT